MLFGGHMSKVVTVEHVNTLLAEAADEQRQRRIDVEYNNMVEELHQEYFAMMRADIEAGYL